MPWFINDEDAEVYRVIMCDEEMAYSIVNLDHISAYLVLDLTLSGQTPVRMDNV